MDIGGSIQLFFSISCGSRISHAVTVLHEVSLEQGLTRLSILSFDNYVWNWLFELGQQILVKGAEEQHLNENARFTGDVCTLKSIQERFARYSDMSFAI